MSKKSLDALGVAITNAGYTWTPEMRSAYEKGIRESEWVGLTDDEINHTPVRWTMINGPGDYLLPFARAIEAKLKEKNT